MPKILKISVFFIGFALILGAALVFAQEETATNTTLETVLDEEVKPEDLGVSEPNILPDSPFYFLKEISRGIQGLFTFNAVDKAKLKTNFANEKLLEVKKMIEQNKNQERIEKGIENYQNEVEKVKMAAEKIKETAEENIEVGKFLDKFTQQQVLHQRILQKLETQVPPEVSAKIEAARERHLEKFSDVMTRLENKEQFQERLEKNLEEIKGSEFKQFKNLELLKELEEKVPEEAKEAIRNAQENSLLKLKEKLQQLPPETQAKFQEYVEKITGEKEIHMEIIDSLKEELKLNPEMKERILQTREKIVEQVQNKVQERIQEGTCPEVKFDVMPCPKGRYIIVKDEKGCDIDIKCVIPADVETPLKPTTSGETQRACVNLWDPVCAKNGKTYSNECFSKISNVEVSYKGECKECTSNTECPRTECIFNQPCEYYECIESSCVLKKQSAVQTNCKPVCDADAVASRSEGWYDSCTKNLIMYGRCEGCKAICKATGTKSEGWYNSCTETLISYGSCEENQACISLRDPVCGKDGKTYSNSCFAKSAGVEMNYKGTCVKECKKESELCGGLAGFLCCPELTCKYEGNYPDAGGKCVKEE